MPRKKRGRPVHGWLNLDKPYGLGSTKAVGRVRWLMEAQKAGHAGTLDPLAQGVLPIALGEATKTVPFLVDATKEYTFDLAFGHETTTGDVEGEATEASVARPSEAAILAALPRFTGEIEQTPPRYSAVKIGGERAYDLARRGEEVDVPSRVVRVDSLSLDSFDGPPERIEVARLSVTCGKGTYVRSIARDLARHLHSRGHVTYLLRTRVGSFELASAIALDALEALEYGARTAALLPIDCALDDIPVLAVGAQDAADLRQGRTVSALGFTGTLLAKLDTTPVAICEAQAGRARPKRVFNI